MNAASAVGGEPSSPAPPAGHSSPRCEGISARRAAAILASMRLTCAAVLATCARSVVLVSALAGCAPAAASGDLHLVPRATSAPATPSTASTVSRTERAEVIEAVPRDGCPGICTRLTARAEDGSLKSVDVPGGIIGDRARIVGERLPPRVGEWIDVGVPRAGGTEVAP